MMYNPSATTTIVSAEVASAAHARTHTAAGGELYAPTGTKGMMEPHNGEWSTQWAHERITQWQREREQAHLTVEREQAQLTVFPRDGSLSWELPVGVGERRGLG